MRYIYPIYVQWQAQRPFPHDLHKFTRRLSIGVLVFILEQWPALLAIRTRVAGGNLSNSLSVEGEIRNLGHFMRSRVSPVALERVRPPSRYV
jgi:hypothetical protein